MRASLILQHLHAAYCFVLQALAAHAANLWDKSYMFKAAAAFTGAGAGQHLLSVLQVKGACRLSLPVLRENLNKVLRGTGGTEAALGSVVHITSAEEAPDTDSDAVRDSGLIVAPAPLQVTLPAPCVGVPALWPRQQVQWGRFSLHNLALMCRQ